MYTTNRHELWHARKAWPGTLVGPCLLTCGPCGWYLRSTPIHNTTPQAWGDGRSKWPTDWFHSLNMELDLQSLFGLLCTAVLIGWHPATPPLSPPLGLFTRAQFVSQDRRRLFVTPLIGTNGCSLFLPNMATKFSFSRVFGSQNTTYWG